MKRNSGDEQALIKIQHEWAEARVKGDSSFTRRLEAENCTVVWPDGSVVNKREDLKSMTGDIVFTEFKIDDLEVRLYGDTAIVVGQGHDQSARRKTKSSRRKICLDGYVCKTGWRMEGGRITGDSGLGKMIAYNYPYSL
jgi:ketosteroid isomerase-like protein